MPDAKRLGAQLRCWVAPVGTDPSDKAAWAELPVSEAGFIPGFSCDRGEVVIRRDDAEQRRASAKRIQDLVNEHLVGAANAAKGWTAAAFANETPAWLRPDPYPSIRQRWMAGMDPQTFPKVNERSKPVGLNNVHTYESPRGHGRKVKITASAFEEGGTYIEVHAGNDGAEYSWVAAVDAVPLALNVLGHDRPTAERKAFTESVGTQFATSGIVTSDTDRDWHLAVAAAYLKAADAYDQREVHRKAGEEAKAKAEAEAAEKAKRDAEYARHKQESYDRAKVTYADAIRDQIASGITAESVAKVQAALSAFETARRKLEGLPN